MQIQIQMQMKIQIQTQNFEVGSVQGAPMTSKHQYFFSAVHNIQIEVWIHVKTKIHILNLSSNLNTICVSKELLKGWYQYQNIKSTIIMTTSKQR